MPCDTVLKNRQTLSQRADEVRRAVARLDKLLANGSVKVKVGPQGAVTFVGWQGASRDGITDACAFRRIMATGSGSAKMAIARAEMQAGRSVNKQIIGQGVHSHDGGETWHGKG